MFGTRPEAIKMCPVVMEMKKNPYIEPVVCLTGQHREMLDQVMRTFKISADIDLDIMKDGQTLADITSGVLCGISSVLVRVNPALIIVHGDTTTAYASALAGFYHSVPIGHVEAGLRTYNLSSPYPEEFNRQSIDMLSQLLFAPTEAAKNNLLQEGKNDSSVIVTGNTVIDALKTTVDKHYLDDNLEWAKGSKLILMTAHRRENLGEPMKKMFRAVRRITDEFEDVKVIYPVHKNPRVREAAEAVLSGDDKIRLIEPLEVEVFHNYIDKSYLVLTDSGGIQEEAPSLGKPVLVMRNTTERPEGIKAGTVKLVGIEEEGIYSSVYNLLVNESEYKRMSEAVNPYGDGHASERIVKEIIRRYM